MRRVAIYSMAVAALSLVGACGSEGWLAPARNGPVSSAAQGGRGAAGGSGGSAVSAGGGGEAPDCTWSGVIPPAFSAPIDLVIAIDNGTDPAAIEAFEEALNERLVSFINANARVIVVTNHGQGFSATGTWRVCIQPFPNGPQDCNGPPLEVPEKFYHYDVDIPTGRLGCVLLETMHAGPDENGAHPDGWGAYLRPYTEKYVILFSDGPMQCSNAEIELDESLVDIQHPEPGQKAAAALDARWLLDPALFGTADSRAHAVYSVVDVPASPDTGYGPELPAITSTCSGAEPGSGYQWLSMLTGAKRYSICRSDFLPVLGEILGEISSDSALSCDVRGFEEPPGCTCDFAMQLWSGLGELGPVLAEVADAQACGLRSDAYYPVSNNYRLCPQTCYRVRGPGATFVGFNGECSPL